MRGGSWQSHGIGNLGEGLKHIKCGLVFALPLAKASDKKQ